MSNFFQEGPDLKNQYKIDLHFQRVLQFFLGRDIPQIWQERLTQLGEDSAGKLLAWSKHAETELPVHVPYDSWGRRVDQVKLCSGWKNLEAYAAENGLIATGYERNDGPQSRLYQMSLLYLFHPSSAFVSCPLAMSDGATRALEVYSDTPEHKGAYAHLVSRNPKDAWTSGQWMTEKTGGSDVSLTETRAERRTTAQGSQEFFLHGVKWFTSAAASQMAMALARIDGASTGGKGLSLFYVQARDANGNLRNIQINRLKDKLGTKAMPTAEIQLLGTPATLVGGEGQGVKKISTLFNITRIYNSVCSLAAMQRSIHLLQDYASKRLVFSKLLKDQPVHQTTWTEILVERAACNLLVFKTVALWGRDECKTANADESALLRLLTTLGKLYTGKRVIQMASEITEMFGGAGYVEDTGLPKLLRDAQVFPIWEGATNVLSLDVVRALSKECPFEVAYKDISDRLQKIDNSSQKNLVAEQLKKLAEWINAHQTNPELVMYNARQFAFELSEIFMKSLLLQMSVVSKNVFDDFVTKTFCARPSWTPLDTNTKADFDSFLKSSTAAWEK